MELFWHATSVSSDPLPLPLFSRSRCDCEFISPFVPPPPLAVLANPCVVVIPLGRPRLLRHWLRRYEP